MANNTYQQLLYATSELLGPASGRFIDRQIESHLNIKPQDLRRKDVEKLAQWIRLAVSVLTDDAATLRSYNKALERLIRGE